MALRRLAFDSAATLSRGSKNFAWGALRIPAPCSASALASVGRIADAQSRGAATSSTSPKMSFSNTDTPSNQPADPYTAKNKDEPDLTTKVTDLVNFIEAQKFCMMTTRVAKEGLLVSRAMALAGKEGEGIDLIFHANTESGKTDDLASDPDINIAFLAPSGEWASVSGTAEVKTDRDFVHKYYSPALKAWLGDLGDGTHDGGPNDPRICAIKVRASTAQYATASRTAVGGAVEVVKGVLTGQAASVNKLRYLSEVELKQWRATKTGAP